MEISTEIANIVKEAAAMVRGAADIGEHVHTKEGVANFVTDYDVAVENYLYEKLAGLLPEARFIGEESDENHSELLEGGLRFIIDPIDGTTNFIRGMRHSKALSKPRGLNLTFSSCEPY